MPRFKNEMMQRQYEGALNAFVLHQASYVPVGLFDRHGSFSRGGGLQCAFWEGFEGRCGFYGRAVNTMGYAVWRAGKDAGEMIARGLRKLEA